MNKVIIIGASSGIGKELARVVAMKGHIVGLAARRLDVLTRLQEELPVKTYAKFIDMARAPEAMGSLRELIDEMNDVDTIVVCSAVTFLNPDIDWDNECNTLRVNVMGVAAMVNVAFDYFGQRGGGHLVGISSFKALRGGGSSPAYNASKAFLSNYLEGLTINSRRRGKNITITDVRPGLVASSPAAASFFVAPVNTVALDIYKAIENKERIAYVPRRYRYIGYVMRSIPLDLYRKLKK